MKSLFHSFLVFICLFSIVSCEEKIQPILVTGITVTPPSLSLIEGESGLLTVSITPKEADNKTVIWNSDDKAVATVDNGAVTAIKAGTATITATTADGGYTATCSVYVIEKAIAVESISLSKTELTLTEGESETIKATVLPDYATVKTVSWSSSNSAIATVEEGKIIAIKEGSTSIIAKAGDKTASCTVLVKRDTLNDPILFADAVFEDYCIKNFDSNGDGEISHYEALAVNAIEICTDNIKSIDEIIYFKNLQTISATGSQWRYGPFTGLWNPEDSNSLPEPPEGISIASGKLSRVVLTGLSKLLVLNINANHSIEVVDINDCTRLISLACEACGLTELDVSNNNCLIYLSCRYNQLLELDLSSNLSLNTLYCDFNHISSLGEGGITDFVDVICDYNQITNLDFKNSKGLKRLSCTNNQIKSLDLSGNLSLTSIWCYDNQLSNLEIGHNTELTDLRCSRNQITSLDVNRCTSLSILDCSSNKLTNLEVKNCAKMETLECSGNQLSNLDISNNKSLKDFGCSDNLLKKLDVSNNRLLVGLGCGNNQLKDLDISNNKSLTDLECRNNTLTRLDVSNLKDLAYLICDNNCLTSLEVSNNSSLIVLWCGNNQLYSLDVSKLTSLEQLTCDHNMLNTLDVSNNLSLTHLWCNFNPNLTEIWLKKGQTIPSFVYDNLVSTVLYK